MPNLGAVNSSAADRCSVAHLFVVGGGADGSVPHLLDGQSAAAAGVGVDGTTDETDVLVLPVSDSYRSLTSKVVSMFEWVVTHIHFRYVLKTDDDSFVCVSRLLEMLRILPRRKLYLGVVNPAHKVISDMSKTQYERWRDPEYIRLFNRTTYAPYMQGAGYILSADLVEIVVEKARVLPTLPAVEDALIGALVEKVAEATSRPSGFRHKNRDDYAVTVCTQDTEFVLLHKLSQEELAKCKQATQRRRSAACPSGPCVCRNLGRKRKVPRKVIRSFSEAQVMAQQHAARKLGAINTFVDEDGEKL